MTEKSRLRWLALVAFGALAARVGAQPADESEAEFLRTQAEYREVQQARTQMEQARRQLEEAARVIATQAHVLPVQDFNFSFNPGFGRRTGLGVTIVDAEGGALVTGVPSGSNADEAGLRVGDVITGVAGQALDGDGSAGEQLRDALDGVGQGQSVSVTVERGGRTLELDVEPTAGPRFATIRPGGQSGARVYGVPGGDDGAYYNLQTRLGDMRNELQSLRLLGFAGSPWSELELVRISPGLGRYFGTAEGLLVVSAPENDDVDIRDGDVILSITGRTPNSPEHAIRILSSFEAGETVEFDVMRDRERMTLSYAVPAAP